MDAKLYEVTGTVEGLDLETTARRLDGDSAEPAKIRVSLYVREVCASLDVWLPHSIGKDVRLGQKLRVSITAAASGP